MSATVSWDLFNELKKGDRMLGLLSIVLVFRIGFNNFNKTGAQIIRFNFHMTLELLTHRILW